MSTRGNPFEELERLFDRMSREFEGASNVWRGDDPFAQSRSEFEPMAIDLVDHADEFVVTVDLPGFERDEVAIRVTNHTLRIEAEHEEAIDEEDENYIRRERSHESTRRSVRLPDEVDTENVTARMNNGVLTITMPKLDVEAARTIEID